jgi:peptidyl-tRNA hydrolase
MITNNGTWYSAYINFKSTIIGSTSGKAMIRFSKENLLNELQNQIAKMEQIWGFVSDNGTNQIKDKNDFDRVVAYGEYRALIDMYDSIRDNTFLNI